MVRIRSHPLSMWAWMLGSKSASLEDSRHARLEAALLGGRLHALEGRLVERVVVDATGVGDLADGEVARRHRHHRSSWSPRCRRPSPEGASVVELVSGSSSSSPQAATTRASPRARASGFDQRCPRNAASLGHVAVPRT